MHISTVVLSTFFCAFLSTNVAAIGAGLAIALASNSSLLVPVPLGLGLPGVKGTRDRQDLQRRSIVQPDEMVCRRKVIYKVLISYNVLFNTGAVFFDGEDVFLYSDQAIVVLHHQENKYTSSRDNLQCTKDSINAKESHQLGITSTYCY